MPLVSNSIVNLYKKKMRDAWDAAMSDALTYVKLVLKNNPDKAEEVLKRTDVAYALFQGMEQALATLPPILDQAALAGAVAGHVSDSTFQTGILTDLLSHLQADLLAISKAVPDAAEVGIRSNAADVLDREFNRLGLRAEFVAEAAVKWGASFTQNEDMRFSSTRAKWTVTSNNPCSFCTALDGEIRPWGVPFEIIGFPLHAANPGFPPIHPNCRCVLIATTP